VENAREFTESYGFDFPLLADPDLAAIDAYGLRHEADGIGDIARPATFVIDREGRIVWRNLTDNWRIRPRPAELLQVLARIH
jgi:peroxiredoxin